jgi:ATP-dependent Lon protease
VLAARRARIKKIIIPQLNRKDLDEIPNSVRSSLEIIPVDEVRQVLEIALNKNSWDKKSPRSSAVLKL